MKFMKALLASLLLALSAVTAFSQVSDRVASTPALNNDWRPGFINITELNGGLGVGLTGEPYSKNFFGITTVNGYQFTRNVKGGIGAGVMAFNGGTLFPVYLDARYSFNAQEFVPFFAGAGGVALSLKDLRGATRIFINPSAGLKWVAANRTGISFSAGLMAMSGGGLRDSFVNFRLGVEFKGKN